MYVVAKLKEQQKNKRRRRIAATKKNQNGKATPATWDASGWWSQVTPMDTDDDQHPLAHHANWSGPVKLVGSAGAVRRVTEVLVCRELFGDQVFDDDVCHQSESLQAELSAVFAQGGGQQSNWTAPDTEDLQRWLTIGGYQPAVDEDDNLRIMVKSREREGQVRLERGAGRLRFTVQLGSWSDLDGDCERAMLDLARQANARGRLARVAWIIEGKKRRCEGQVDLTGLPTKGPAERIWPDMICISMHGLELLLRRLPIELDVLADDANRAVAAQLFEPELVGVVSAAVS